MRTRNMAVLGALLVVIALVLVWGLGRSGAARSGQASSPAVATGPRRDAEVDPAGRPSSSPVPASEIPALQARDQRRRAAIGPFGVSVLADLDRCIPPGPGPRVPQQFGLAFVRSSKATAGQEAFELKSISPLGMRPDQPPVSQTPLGACLSGLVGRTLLIPVGEGVQEASFQEIIAVPLPASVAWASPQPPQLPVP